MTQSQPSLISFPQPEPLTKPDQLTLTLPAAGSTAQPHFSVSCSTSTEDSSSGKDKGAQSCPARTRRPCMVFSFSISIVLALTFTVLYWNYWGENQ